VFLQSYPRSRVGGVGGEEKLGGKEEEEGSTGVGG